MTTYTTTSRQTGTSVTLTPGDDLPWMLVCEEHDRCCEFHTKREAQRFAATPADWCEDCGDAWAAKIGGRIARKEVTA